ncbi:MAG: PqqD family peptide modification chaperone [Clostridia bacterium]|nr:PqqD family peptide modification chaperone [Clostridia bacterium]
MYYRIGEITFCSQLALPSYEVFSCAPSTPDVTLEVGGEAPGDGTDVETGFFVCRSTGDGWFYHADSEDGTGLAVSGDYSRLRLIRSTEGPPALREECYIRTALECLLIRRGYVSLHAACVQSEGAAVAFTGDSGVGKSTRAKAWWEAFQTPLISGDRPLVQVKNLEVFGVPWDGKEGCYKSVRFPLGWVCEVRRSPVNYLRKMTFQQKRRLLMRQCFLPMWDTDTAAMQMMNIVRLASQANILRAFGGPDAEDARVLKRMLDTNQVLKEESEMKAKDGFVLRNIVDEHVLMPTGDNINQFGGTVIFNEQAAFLWEKLQYPVSRDDLLAAMVNTYAVDEATAASDLDAVLEKMKALSLITEEA